MAMAKERAEEAPNSKHTAVEEQRMVEEMGLVNLEGDPKIISWVLGSLDTTPKKTDTQPRGRIPLVSVLPCRNRCDALQEEADDSELIIARSVARWGRGDMTRNQSDLKDDSCERYPANRCGLHGESGWQGGDHEGIIPPRLRSFGGSLG